MRAHPHPAVLPDSYRATLSAFGAPPGLTAQLRCCWTADSQPKERYPLPFRLTLMELRDFQDTMREIYLKRDEQRGVDATFRWLTEELGELARAVRLRRRPGRGGGGGVPLHAVVRRERPRVLGRVGCRDRARVAPRRTRIGVPRHADGRRAAPRDPAHRALPCRHRAVPTARLRAGRGVRRL